MTLFRRILVPHDFSSHASRALALAVELARAHGGRLLVLNVVPPIYPFTGLPPESLAWISESDLIAEERRRLSALVARVVRGRNAPRAECRVEMGDPLARIMRAAREADSIVMATAGRTGLSHMVIGSVAEKVVRHAPIPVLTVHASGTGTRRRRGGRASVRGRQLRAARRR
jgi:universal stress protein A